MDTFELLQLYATGERDFPETKLSNAYLAGANLSGINFGTFSGTQKTTPG